MPEIKKSPLLIHFTEAVISRVKAKLGAFGNTKMAQNVDKELTGLSGKWSQLSDDEQSNIQSTLDVVASSIESFANAKDNPVGAIQGAMNIIGSISSNFGPMGQLVGMGLGFVSSLLGLFGAGPEPVPLTEVVGKEVRKALEEYHDRNLRNEADGVINALSEIKGYLDGFARAGINGSVSIAAVRSPITLGAKFVGKLISTIEQMFEENKANEARKCLRYLEIYTRITALRDLIFTQSIAISDNEKDIHGLIGTRDIIRETTKGLLKKIYHVNYDSKILPYFDPDYYPTTDAYARAMFDLGKYDRSLANSLYCLYHANYNKELSWDRYPKEFRVSGKPYTTLYSRDNDNCFWKLVPHGQNAYSIVNRYKCDKGYAYCGALLTITGELVTIEHDDPMLWQILGHTRYKR